MGGHLEKPHWFTLGASGWCSYHQNYYSCASHLFNEFMKAEQFQSNSTWIIEKFSFLVKYLGFLPHQKSPSNLVKFLIIGVTMNQMKSKTKKNTKNQLNVCLFFFGGGGTGVPRENLRAVLTKSTNSTRTLCPSHALRSQLYSGLSRELSSTHLWLWVKDETGST